MVRSVSGVYIAIWTELSVTSLVVDHHYHHHHLLLPANMSWDTCWLVPVSHVWSPFNGLPWRISLLILIMYTKNKLHLNVTMLALILLTHRQKINFDILLILHLSIILTTDQLNAKILFCDKFIIFLYIFRALCAHHQEVKLYYTASGIVTLAAIVTFALPSCAHCTPDGEENVTIMQKVWKSCILYTYSFWVHHKIKLVIG